MFSISIHQSNILYKSSAAAAAESLQSCPTLCDPIDGSPPGSRPWHSPGKNTGVGCHFLLQCMKVKSEVSLWKWSHSYSSRPHGLQPTRLLHPWDFPGKSTGVGCHRLLWHITDYGVQKQNWKVGVGHCPGHHLTSSSIFSSLIAVQLWAPGPDPVLWLPCSAQFQAFELVGNFDSDSLLWFFLFLPTLGGIPRPRSVLSDLSVTEQLLVCKY